MTTPTIDAPAPFRYLPGTHDPDPPAPGADQAPYELRLSAAVARELGRYLTPIVARVKHAITERTATTDRLTIDLTDAAAVPGSSLITLITLLRHALGPDAVITLTGVRPQVVSTLVSFGLPHGTVVVDSKGRQWVA